ncbi:hypothetical protein SAMN05660464_2627 [Geodermatophilus dictyosporus]|uniref:Uncharacterized protein n=1 Tax=Geodermatophilus dictyosporus TaxID=1523247 RepID=A0A1I5NPM7_9ACTN|nr:hypothetical protein [Geodermatophilus dictyosporus]SFP23637.1 hypothetical protein SAMN05660464_2627 [Geodermatophilus dictyosporus]
MSRRDPGEARVLGLWTAGWLFALLSAGILRFGDLSVQWPVLLVPVLWGAVALRPRRRARARGRQAYDEADDDLRGWPPRDDVPPPGRPAPTREMPASWQQPWPPGTRDRRRG